MLKNIQKKTLSLLVLSSLMLSACGGGGNSTPDPSKVLQESQLYHPDTNPAGTVEQPGQTAVLGLEANVSDLPPPSDASKKGVENLWFEVKDSQRMQFALDADILAAIDRVEIRDQGNTLLATVKAATPSITLNLEPGRYQALLYASAASTTLVPVFAQYAVPQAGNVQAQATTALGRVQPQYSFLSAFLMFFGKSCPGCALNDVALPGWNLSGRDFSYATLSGATLNGANFSWANLSRAQLDGAKLSGVNFTRSKLIRADFHGANLSGADLSGADLFDANLGGANLGSANLSEAKLYDANLAGANLSGANLSGAKLTGANLTGTNLILTQWVDGRTCGFESIGTCR